MNFSIQIIFVEGLDFGGGKGDIKVYRSENCMYIGDQFKGTVPLMTFGTPSPQQKGGFFPSVCTIA